MSLQKFQCQHIKHCTKQNHFNYRIYLKNLLHEWPTICYSVINATINFLNHGTNSYFQREILIFFCRKTKASCTIFAPHIQVMCTCHGSKMCKSSINGAHFTVWTEIIAAKQWRWDLSWLCNLICFRS